MPTKCKLLRILSIRSTCTWISLATCTVVALYPETELSTIFLLFALLVSTLYLFSATQTLTELSDLATTVATKNDFSLRAYKKSSPEITALVRAFNSLLDQVEQHQEKLNLNNDILEKEVIQRTSELTAAKKLAEQANQAKVNFLANISHEIRTPMNGILGMTDLALEIVKDLEARSILEVVKTSGDALLTVVNDLLDYSKIGSGTFSLNPCVFSPKDLVRNIHSMIAVQTKAKGQILISNCDPKVPSLLLGDSGRIQQVLLNFLSNALKFSPEKSNIEMGAKITDENDITVTIHFWVKDSGIGICQEQQDLIFEPFQQADSSITRRFGGTGLGLAISKKLITLMNGRIRVESSPNQGSTFHCELTLPYFNQSLSESLPETYLPQKRLIACDFEDAGEKTKIFSQLRAWGFKTISIDSLQEELSKDNDKEGNQVLLIIADHLSIRRNMLQNFNLPILELDSTLSKEELFVELQNIAWLKLIKTTNKNKSLLSGALTRTQLRILVAEDNLVNQNLISRILTKKGHRVVIANNGIEAINAYKNEEFDIILMDCQMPELDGTDATRKIRLIEQNTNKHIPIIALTALAMEGDREICLASGMDDYLSKPLKAEDLFGKIKENTSVVTKN